LTILRDYAEEFVSFLDDIAMIGMRILGNPLRGDDRIVSDESGAVIRGAKALSLDETSKVLLLSTEGDTDPTMYRKIVWGSWE